MLWVSGVKGSLMLLVSGAEWSLELVLWDVCLTCVGYCSAVGALGDVVWCWGGCEKLVLGGSVALAHCNV
jgi:hypothetical protein